MIVPIRKLEAGLRVLEAVVDSHGGLLLPAQARLTETILVQLEARGVGAVDVEIDESPAEREERVSRERARIAFLFGEEDSSAELAQLRTALLERVDA